MGYTTPYYLHGIYHSILSSWDIPLHIILMHSIPYYPHGRITPLSQYSYILLLIGLIPFFTKLIKNQFQFQLILLANVVKGIELRETLSIVSSLIEDLGN